MSRGVRIRIGKLVVSGDARAIQRAIEKHLRASTFVSRRMPSVRITAGEGADAIGAAVAAAVAGKKEGR